MMYNPKLTALSAAILFSTLSACGGGGGGGGNDDNDNPPAPRQQLTALPAFLQGNEVNCSFVESGNDVSLEAYSGNLNNVTGLTCNGVTLSDLNEISLLTALETLNLEDAGLTNVNELLNISTLSELDLSGNPLTDLATIASLLNLTALDLDNTGLSDLTLLQSLTALQQLNLADNDISNVTALGNLMALTSLDLSGNSITELTSLGALTNLQILDVSGNNSLACVDINNLDNTLGGATDITVPSDCTTALYLDNTSDATQTLDLSMQAIAFDRLVIGDIQGRDDIVLFQSGNDLRVTANTSAGEKQITFSNWFSDEAYQLGEFEIGSEGVSRFDDLRAAVGLGLALTDQDDTYSGSNGNDIIYGLDGNDIIAGERGADVIVGGSGSDILSGHKITIDDDSSVTRSVSYDSDQDTIVFNLGDGNDIIYEYEASFSNRALLQFGTGIAPADITLYRNGLDLVFQINAEDSVTVFEWFKADKYRIGQIQFGNNDPIAATEWVNAQPLSSNDITVTGTDASESLIGSTDDDIIYGLDGSDIITGGEGNDILSGYRIIVGEDNSVTRYPSYDNDQDTFVFNPGDGNDIIYEYEVSFSNRALLQFGAGIAPADITLYRNGLDLVFQINAEDSVTIFEWFDADQYRIGQIQFGNDDPIAATEWVNAQPVSLQASGILEGDNDANVLTGTGGNDIIYGLDGVDIIAGGKGNDILSGNRIIVGEDNSVTRSINYDNDQDIFVFNLGDDNDIIYEYEVSLSNRALLQFGAGITPIGVTATQAGEDLVLTVSASDSVRVKDWFNSANYRLGQIQFDGLPAQDATTFVATLLNPPD